jgi:hypothetical protein
VSVDLTAHSSFEAKALPVLLEREARQYREQRVPTLAIEG